MRPAHFPSFSENIAPAYGIYDRRVEPNQLMCWVAEAAIVSEEITDSAKFITICTLKVTRTFSVLACMGAVVAATLVIIFGKVHGFVTVI